MGRTVIPNLNELENNIKKLDPNATVVHKYHKARMIRKLNCTIHGHKINKSFKNDKDFKRYLTFLPYVSAKNDKTFKTFTQQYSYREYRNLFNKLLEQFT